MKMMVWFVFVLAPVSAASNVVITRTGQKATLQCSTTGTWNYLQWNYGNDLIIRTDAKTGFTRKGNIDIVRRAALKNTQLDISDVKETDAGKFICSTDKMSEGFTLLVVTISVHPSVDLQEGTEATIRCQVNGASAQWKWPNGKSESPEVVLNSVSLSDNGIWECIISHEGKTFIESLEIRVKATATTPAGRQNTDKIKPGINGTPTRPRLLLGLVWWMWIAIGAGFTVVVFLMILVICLCKRIKRKKRKLRAMKMSKRLLVPKQYCQCKCPTPVAEPQQRRRREKPSALQTLQVE